MAFTAAERTQVFEVLGLPEGGAGLVLGELAGAFGPVVESADLYAVSVLVGNFLTAVSASQEARVRALLVRHAAITSSSPLQVRAAAGGVRGVLVDHPAEREAIREALGTILGIAVPLGGFVAEAVRKARGVGGVGR